MLAKLWTEHLSATIVAFYIISPLGTSAMALVAHINRVLRPISDSLTRSRRSAALDKLLVQGLPAMFAKPARFLVTGELEREAQAVRERIETQRQRIAAGGAKLVDILYSPKPGSSGNEVTPKLRPEHGKIKPFTMERVARTGKGERWGTFLHLLASEVTGHFLELGSCAGVSGSYLAAAPTCEKLVTIEGSPALARLARETTSKIAPGRVEVITGLFDEVLDNFLPALGNNKLDLVFIDGHHERIATLHYFERIKPVLRTGSVIVFDDVSWSRDMRVMWEEVVQKPCISHAVDVGPLGIVIFDPDCDRPGYWDLQPIVGRYRVNDKPWGWQE